MAELIDIINEFRSVGIIRKNIANKFRIVSLVLSNIQNKFRIVIAPTLSDIQNRFHSITKTITSIVNNFQSKGLMLYNITNNFRAIATWQIPGDAGVLPLGKTKFEVKINNVDITESLNIDLDTLSWRETLNAGAEATFVLGIPYDSGSVPTLNQTVEIIFNKKRKFYGYITNITKSDTPEGIEIHAEDEYHNLNKTLVSFEIGHGKTYSTYSQALSALGFSAGIGSFVPYPENYVGANKADTISSIVDKCGIFKWFIKPNGSKALWQGGTGAIINLEKQEIGINLGLYQVIDHNIVQNDVDKIGKIKVIMGDSIKVGYDNSSIGIHALTVFYEKPDWDKEVYNERYTKYFGWSDERGGKSYVDKEVTYQGWKIIVPGGYSAGFPLKDDGIYWYQYPGYAGGNIEDVWQYLRRWKTGGIYPEGRKSHVFFVGSGNIIKELNLSHLNVQVGANYSKVISESFNEQETRPSLPPSWIIFHPNTSPSMRVKIPSWDDTSYAVNIANLELYKNNITKQIGTLKITIDSADYYDLDLSKRIKCLGILNNSTNIASINYDVGSYTCTINVETNNYYKRTVSIPLHS